MKRVLSIVLMLLVVSTVTAYAADSGYRFEARDLGLYVLLPEEWMDAIENQKLSFFTRADDEIQTDALNGYALFLHTPDLSEYSGFDTYAEAEAWLAQNATVLGGVISYDAKHATDADFADIYPEYTKRAHLDAGDTGYVVFTTQDAPDNDAMTTSVHDALSAPDGLFELFDATVDYGALGVLDTETIDGEHIHNADFADNKVTVLMFWGTYCDSCMDELPHMGELARKYADRGVGFLGIVTDVQDEDSMELARLIAEDTQADFPHIPPDIDRELLYSVQYLPTVILLDANGHQIGDMHVGYTDEATLAGFIDEALGAQA